MRAVKSEKLRYVLLFSATLIIILAMFLYKKTSHKNTIYVSTLKVELTEFEEKVSCEGKVESLKSEKIYAEYPCVVKNVNVKMGDKVSVGDTLFTVDVDATKEVVANQIGVSPDFVSDNKLPLEVKATSSGTVSTIDAVPGEIILTDVPCAILSSGDDIQIKITIPENQVKKIKEGQEVHVSGVAFTRERYLGKLSNIATTARQNFTGFTTETVVDAIITLAEQDVSIKPGLTANTNIIVGKKTSSIILPFSCVSQDDSNNEFVYVYKNNEAVKRIVETGKDLESGFEIVSGLEPGEEIITDFSKISKDKMAVKKN